MEVSCENVGKEVGFHKWQRTSGLAAQLSDFEEDYSYLKLANVLTDMRTQICTRCVYFVGIMYAYYCKCGECGIMNFTVNVHT